jgi:hypothetical protein
VSRFRLLAALALSAAPTLALAQAPNPPAFTAFGDSTHAAFSVLPPPIQCTPVNTITPNAETFNNRICQIGTAAHVAFRDIFSAQLGGPLRFADSTLAVNAPATRADNVATLVFGDVLTVTGPVAPSFADFLLNETGTIGTTGPAGASASLETCFGHYTALPIRALDACEPGTELAPDGSHVYGAGTVDTSYVETASFLIDPSTGRPSNTLSFFYALRATTSLGLLPGQFTLDGAAGIDFFHTALIAGLRLRDAAGNDITDQVQITSASGATYPPFAITAPAPVPEPSSLALLAAGLAAVAVAARARHGPA